MRIIWASVRYWLMAFGAGFVLGAARVLALEPWLRRSFMERSELVAVAIEGPLMLAISWMAARLVLWRGDWSIRQALAVGWLAWLLLQISELALALSMGGSATAYLAKLQTAAGLLGVVLQIVFALIPAIRIGVARRRAVR